LVFIDVSNVVQEMDVKKILFLSYDGLTDPLGQSQVLPYLQQLSKKGFRFTIISFEKKDRYEKEKKIIEEITAASEIEWIPLSFTSKPPVISKAWDRYRMWNSAHKLYLKHRYRIIHCRSYVAAEVGLKLKNRYGAKFLFDMRGFWADEKVDNGQWDLKNPLFRFLYKIYKKKEKQFLQHADGIVSLTEASKKYLINQPGYKNLSIDVIPCCADLEHFNYNSVTNVSGEQLRSKLRLTKNEKLLTYLGSVGGWYLTKEMFKFFKVLKSKYPEFKMLILTKDNPDMVREEAATFNIDNDDLIVTYTDRKTLPVYLSITDLSIFFIKNSFSKKASSPTKHAELMGMGVPVICNDIGDTGNIITKTGTGAVVKEFTDQDYQKIVDNLDQLLNIDKLLIRKSALEYFDLKNGSEKYENLYLELVKE
jgi:glycosyltransferase involved in cell wall biosynthesis